MNRSWRALAALTSAAALTVAGMSPASAAFWAHNDAVGDVVSYTWTEDSGDSGPVRAPANTDTDITRFTAKHTARRVVLTMTLRDITAASGVAYYEIRTGTRRYWAQQRLGTNREQGPAFYFESPVSCSGVRRSVDRTTERAMVSIPRSCLGRPRWVRVGASADHATDTRTKDTYRFDDALRDGGRGFELVLSPRIRRG
jgi:hypothetical protein